MLLYSVSSWGSAPWSSFKKAFDEIYAARARSAGAQLGEPTRHDRQRAAWLLECLGHCDIVFENRIGRINAAPAVLAALPWLGLPTAVLCGRRSPDTFQELRAACSRHGQRLRARLTRPRIASSCAPSRIEIEGDTPERLSDLAQQLRITYADTPPAWSLMSVAPSLDEYLGKLTWDSVPEINWERWDFDPAHLRFGATRVPDVPLRLSKYVDPVRGLSIYRLWRNGLSAPIDPSWGRFAVLQCLRKSVISQDAHSGVVIVPVTVRLPGIYSRGLALCSGRAPTLQPGTPSFSTEAGPGYDLFHSVPNDVFRLLADKLGQS
jgi:hypothetical protein